MKKLLFTSAAILLAFIGMQAQSDAPMVKTDTRPANEERKEIKKEKKDHHITLRKLEGNEVAYASKEEFYRDYGNVQNVEWVKAKYFDEAIFDKDGISTTAYFDSNSELVGTTLKKTFTDLPAAAQKQINKEYKDYTVTNILFFDDNEDVDTDMILYGGQFDDEDNYFVELRKDNKTVVVQVTMNGEVGFFADAEK